MRFKPPQQTPEQLRKQCAWRRKSAISKCSATGDCDADVDLWSQTLNEAEQGWILGPFHDEEEVSKHLGTTEWLCARRFPVVQNEKVRVIDDCLQSGVNTAYSAHGC